MEFDVFISYEHSDEEFAAYLAKRLARFRSMGQRLRVAFAPAGIKPGQSIPGRLIQMLENSRVTLAVVTPSWVQSPWCTFETETRLWKDPAAQGRRLLPLMVKSTRLPSGLARLKYVDFRPPGAFDAKLLDVVQSIREIMQDAASAQEARGIAADILRESLLPWVPPAGPNLKFLWPELLVDPFVRSYRRPSQPIRFSAFRAEEARAGTYIVVSGDPGAGKSTALRSLVLDALNRRDAATLRHASQDMEAESSDGRGGSIWAVDGLDEVTVERARDVFALAEGKARQGYEVWVGVRSEFLFRHAPRLKESWKRIDEVVEIEPWGDDATVEFVESYARKAQREDIIPMAMDLLGSALSKFLLRNPMRVTLMLFILIHSAEQVEFNSEFGLYEKFYREWLRAESARGTSRASESAILAAHTRAARWLDDHKQQLYAQDDGMELLRDSGFTGLLDFSRGDGFAFRHETIGEWLIAADMVKSFMLGGAKVDDCLQSVVGDNVNRFVRSAFGDLGATQRRTIASNLLVRYEELKEASGKDAVQAAFLREQLLYYLGRVGDAVCSDTLAAASREEESPLLRRAAALGAILNGDSQVEAEFVRFLKTPEGDLLNRSVQMAYFGDVDMDLHVHVDGGGDWSRVRSMLIERLQEESFRADRLRLWDALTLLSFARARGEMVLSDPEANAIEGTVTQLALEGSERGGQIADVLREALTFRVIGPSSRGEPRTAPWLGW